MVVISQLMCVSCAFGSLAETGIRSFRHFNAKRNQVIYLCGNGNRWDPYGAPRPGVLKGKPARALVLDAAEEDSPAEEGWPSDDSDEVEAADEEEAISRCLESTEGSALI